MRSLELADIFFKKIKMERKMSNQEKNGARECSIESIVKNEKNEVFFEIPPYQRLYEWEKEQIETLLEDVKKAQEEKKDIYFIGNVVVSKEGERYILIDGQQRLTTLFLIGIYLASKEETGNNPWLGFVKSDKKLRISMPLRENEERWLSELIDETKGKGFKEDLKTSSEIHQKIADGLKTIQTWFEQNSQIPIEQFSSFLFEKVCFALVELAKDTDLNQFFVRMNNRGKQLEKHEILKARLLGVIEEQKGDWKTYAKIWDLCSDMDKYIFQSASDRNFLKDSKNEEGNQNNNALYEILQHVEKGGNGNNGGNSKDDDDLEKVKSIIDFPTFLLHVAKLVSSDKDISINKDKLLEIIVISEQVEQKVLCLGKNKVEVEEFILAMLKYRILFDYFVIKRMVDESLSKGGEYSIRCLYLHTEKNNTYYSIGGSVMEKLAMIQNYLRVARAGDKQNYHHWLTPFLKEVARDNRIKKEVQKICDCATNINIINNLQQELCIEFLENLDTDLAYAQMGRIPEGNTENNDNLLTITKQYLEGKSRAEWNKNKKVNFDDWTSNLNQGTGTPHYWFYRLEYYLWKDKENKENIEMKIDGKPINFGAIADNYRFRGLNSIEHIQPQSKAEGDWEGEMNGKDRKIDCFGNLALISQSFNSSLSNQDSGDKSLDLQKRINKEDVESLKLWLAFVKIKNNENKWTYGMAEEHQKEMLEILKASLEQK